MISVNASAQYEESIQFNSFDSFIINKILFIDVYKRSAETMKSSIKKIKIKDEQGRIQHEISVDIEGRITRDVIRDIDGKIIKDITAGYDIKNNIASINYRMNEDISEIKCRFIYVGNTLLSYEKYLTSKKLGDEFNEQCELRYDDASDKSKITGYDSQFFMGDSIPYAVNFKYDMYNRLIDVRVVQDIEPIYEISYSGDTIKIANKSGYQSYVVRENKIIHYRIFSEELNFTGEKTFSYDENGLIEKVYFSDMNGNKYMQKFEYDYYH